MLIMQVPFDPNAWVTKGTAIAAGCCIAAAAGAFWPCVSKMDARAGVRTRGSLVGAVVVGGLLALQLLLRQINGFCLTLE